MKIYHQARLLDVINLFRDLENDSTGNDYLTRLAIYEIHRAIGSHVSLTEVRELFEESCAMEE